jgi:hypothetical protein
MSPTSPAVVIGFIVIVIMLTFGGGWGWSRAGYYGGPLVGGGLVMIVALVIAVFLLHGSPWG